MLQPSHAFSESLQLGTTSQLLNSHQLQALPAPVPPRPPAPLVTGLLAGGAPECGGRKGAHCCCTHLRLTRISILRRLKEHPRSRAPFSPGMVSVSRLCGLQQSEPQPETLPGPYLQCSASRVETRDEGFNPYIRSSDYGKSRAQAHEQLAPSAMHGNLSQNPQTWIRWRLHGQSFSSVIGGAYPRSGWLRNMRGSQSSLKRFRVVPAKSSPLQTRMCSKMQNCSPACDEKFSKLSNWYGKSVCACLAQISQNALRRIALAGPGLQGFDNIHFQLTGAFMLRSGWGCGIPAEGRVERALSAPACRSASRQSRSPSWAANISAVWPRTRGRLSLHLRPWTEAADSPGSLQDAHGGNGDRMLQPSQLLNSHQLQALPAPVPPRPPAPLVTGLLAGGAPECGGRKGAHCCCTHLRLTRISILRRLKEHPRSRAPFSPGMVSVSRLCGLQQSEPQPETLPGPYLQCSASRVETRDEGFNPYIRSSDYGKSRAQAHEQLAPSAMHGNLSQNPQTWIRWRLHGQSFSSVIGGAYPRSGWLRNMRGSQSSLKRFRVVPAKSSPLQTRMCSKMQNCSPACDEKFSKLSNWYGKSVCACLAQISQNALRRIALAGPGLQGFAPA